MKYTNVSTIPARSNTVVNSTTTTSMSGGFLPHERGDAPLQLGQLERFYEHTVARHLGEPSPGQMRDVPRQEQDALGERRPLLLEMLKKLRTIHFGHAQIRENDVWLESF